MKNVQKKSPSIFIIIALVGFPQISESIFTPILPALSRSFQTSAQTSQLTMSCYFIGFACGVLFWGWLSDRIGRRPAMLWGIVIYFLGNLSLFFSLHFSTLISARLIQAFGAAVGSVVTQTIMRESFSGIEGTQVFAKVSAAMALSPAIGPLIGGGLQTYFNDYHSVFSALIAMAVLLWFYVLWCLPETYQIRVSPQSTSTPWTQVIWRMIKSPRVWIYSAFISGINGILFSYYAEAPFIFQRHFGLSAIQYGALGLVIAVASIFGALTTNHLAKKYPAKQIIHFGLGIAFLGSMLMLGVAELFVPLLCTIFTTFYGINIALPIVLNRALIGFEDVIGTASGLLSFGYYIVVSGLTLLMSQMHDGTVLALPRFISIILSILLLHDLLGHWLLEE